jgi:predicted MFS family arabinose efflux permease
MSRTEPSIPLIVVVLAITQLVGWGTMSLPAVIGEQLAQDLGLSLPAVFAGTTTNLVVTGITGMLLANVFVRYGAARVMAVGSLIAAPGFWLLATASGPLSYYAGWIVLGVAGAAMLSTPTYILLNEVAGAAAKRPIGALMLVTGLSSSVFWPITAALSGVIGWRWTVAIYGAAMIVVCFPLHYFGLPRQRPERARNERAGANGTPAPANGRLTFALLVGAIVMNTCVGWGFASLVIQLLKSLGVAEDWALRLGSLLGVVQMGARALDFLGGARWSGLTTAIVAGVITPLGILALLLGGSHGWAIAGFMLLYGAGSGAMAVARATMPLVFYDAAEFARVSSRIALPINLAAAAAPPVLVAVLINFGGNAVLSVILGFSLMGLALLICLALVRRKSLAAAADQ